MISIINITATLVVGYVVWRLTTFIQSYFVMRKICRHPNVAQIGPIHWFWGNVKDLKDISTLRKMCSATMNKTKTKILSIWIPFCKVLITVIHPDTVKVILRSSEPKPKAFAEPYYIFVPWLGDGLVLSEGRKWERNRKLLTPAFHFNVLRPYVKIYNEVADILLDRLAKAGKNGEDFVEIDETLSDAALDSMLRCAFSLDVGIQKDDQYHPYPQAIRRLGVLMLAKLLKPWCHVDLIYRMYSEGREYHRNLTFIHKYVEDVIRQRKLALKNEPKQAEKRWSDFLDILLTAKDEEDVGLTDKEIRDEVNTFMFAGHDTSSTTMTWAMYCCAKYPEEQETVYKEVKRILGNRKNMEWEDIQNMPCMTMFLKETLRMFSTAHGIDRKLTKETEIDGVKFPAGTTVLIMLTLLTKHPSVWEEPEEFRPERFSDTAPERDPYSFVPFSAGPRNCIGQNFAMNELKVFLSKILHRFKIILDKDHVVEPALELTLRPTNGVKVKLVPRTI